MSAESGSKKVIVNIKKRLKNMRNTEELEATCSKLDKLNSEEQLSDEDIEELFKIFSIPNKQIISNEEKKRILYEFAQMGEHNVILGIRKLKDLKKEKKKIIEEIANAKKDLKEARKNRQLRRNVKNGTAQISEDTSEINNKTGDNSFNEINTDTAEGPISGDETLNSGNDYDSDVAELENLRIPQVHNSELSNMPDQILDRITDGDDILNGDSTSEESIKEKNAEYTIESEINNTELQNARDEKKRQMNKTMNDFIQKCQEIEDITKFECPNEETCRIILKSNLQIPYEFISQFLFEKRKDYIEILKFAEKYVKDIGKIIDSEKFLSTISEKIKKYKEDGKKLNKGYSFRCYKFKDQYKGIHRQRIGTFANATGYTIN